MLGKIKYVLRKARREGRAVGLIDAAVTLWHKGHNARDRFNRGRVIRALKSQAEAPPADADALVSFVMDNFNGFLRPIQQRKEITALVKRLQATKPKRVLEVGTAKGGTLFLLCQCAADDATIISLDLPYGLNGGGYPEWKRGVYDCFKKPGQKLVLLRANSHEQASVDKVREILGGAPLDFAFIDGDHSYDGVKRDFELYSPLVAKGGLVGLHDILANRFDPLIDVHRFWVELKQERNTEEIVNDYNQGNLGIGLVGASKSGEKNLN